jgi:hypothetical protein
MARDSTNSNRVITDTWLPTDQAGNPLHDPLSPYKATDQDIAGDPLYYGFVAVDGSWYILKATNSTGTFRYAVGTSNYKAAWALRVNLGYDYFHIVF